MTTVAIIYTMNVKAWSGGLVTYVEVLEKYIRQREPDITLSTCYLPTNFPPDSPKNIKNRAHVIISSVFSKRRIRDFLENNKIDVALTVGLHYPETKYLLDLKKEFGYKVVVTQHAIAEYTWRQRFSWQLFMRLYAQRLLNKVDACINVSTRNQKILQAWADEPHKIKCVFNGVDLPNLRPASPVERAAAKEYWGWSADDHVLSFVGRLAPVKNLETIIQALPKINARFLIAGTGQSEKRLEALVKNLNLENKVKFAGTLLHGSKAWLKAWQAADVLPHMSLYEGLPFTVVEAAAMGLPIVASRVAGVEDVVVHGETGYLIDDAHNQEAFVEHVNRLLQDENLRRDMGAKAAERARELFTTETMGRETVEIIRETLNPKQI